MIGTSPLAREFWEHGRSALCPIYDMHGHMGTFHSIYFPRAEAADMIRTMDECGVRMLVFSHHHALFAPDVGNVPAVEAVRRYPDRLRAYCALNANYPEQLEVALAERAAGAVLAGQPVEQAGFAGIGPPGDHHGHAVAQQAPLAGIAP